jgi:chromosome partitioning protein
MNCIVFAARKGGTGKSTLAANLAAHVARPSRPTLLIDSDPQGSLAFWHQLRGDDMLALRNNPRNVAEALKKAKAEGFEWAFVDTAPIRSSAIAETIRAATLVIIPTRPSVFDVVAVEETIAICRACRKPYAVVINGAPPKRGDYESLIVTDMRGRLAKNRVPVWAGQITQRSTFSLSAGEGRSARELDADGAAAAEIAALWAAVSRSIGAITGAIEAKTAMHKAA